MEATDVDGATWEREQRELMEQLTGTTHESELQRLMRRGNQETGDSNELDRRTWLGYILGRKQDKEQDEK